MNKVDNLSNTYTILIWWKFLEYFYTITYIDRWETIYVPNTSLCLVMSNKHTFIKVCI
jgi:hypothetical protein